MAKCTRKQLKNIVKECLVEILSEGLAKTPQKLSESIKRSSRQTSQAKRLLQSMRTQGESVNDDSRNSDQINAKKVEESIRESVGLLTDDPVMSQILSDTAVTTLQDQLQADSASTLADHSLWGSGGEARQVEAVGDVSDIFSEGAKNWATLAFADSPKK